MCSSPRSLRSSEITRFLHILLQILDSYIFFGTCHILMTNLSLSAFSPPFPIGMYAVSKTSLLGLTKGLAAELGPQGIRVNGVAPGIVPTKFASALVEDPILASQTIWGIRILIQYGGTLIQTNPGELNLCRRTQQEKAQIEATALKRLGKPEDMAAAVAFLCSDDASYVTGETLVVAGGLQSRL